MCKKTLSLKNLIKKSKQEEQNSTIKLPWFFQWSLLCILRIKARPLTWQRLQKEEWASDATAFRLTGLCYLRLTQSSQSEVLSTLVCSVSSLLSDLTQLLLSAASFQPGNLSIFSPALPLSPLQFYAFHLNDTGTTSSSPTEHGALKCRNTFWFCSVFCSVSTTVFGKERMPKILCCMSEGISSDNS